MQTESKHISDNIIEAKITIDSLRVTQEKVRLAKTINNRNPIPGFRPGHAPAAIVANQYGQAEFDREVATTLIREAVINYLIENQINPVIDPKIDVTNFGEELTFTATFTTRPKVELGNYRKIKAKRPKSKEVKDDEVDKIITNLHERSNYGNTHVDPETGQNYILDAKGQKIMLGKSKQGPLDDSFAKEFGAQTLEELKGKIRNNLVSENERQAEADYETTILEELVKVTKVNLPETLVELEVTGMINRLESQVQGMGANFDEYLKQQKKTREELTQDFNKNARKTLTASLGLDEIAAENNLKVSEDEVTSHIHPEHADHEGEKESIRVQLLRREALALLKNEITKN